MSTRSLLTSLTLLIAALSFPACKKHEEATPSAKPAELPPVVTPPPAVEKPAEPPIAAAPIAPQVVRFSEVACMPVGKGEPEVTTSAPEGAVCVQTAKGLLIAAGDSFNLVVQGVKAKPDMKARKREIESSTGERFRRYSTDSADVLIWEAEDANGQPRYHFIAAKKIGNKDYACEDDPTKTYTREQIEAMGQACLTLGEKVEQKQNQK